MLSRVLLHVIETAVGVNRAAHCRPRLESLSVTFNNVQDVAGLLVFRDVFHANAGGAIRFQPAGVEDLAAAGGIERRPVENNRLRR